MHMQLLQSRAKRQWQSANGDKSDTLVLLMSSIVRVLKDEERGERSMMEVWLASSFLNRWHSRRGSSEDMPHPLMSISSREVGAE